MTLNMIFPSGGFGSVCLSAQLLFEGFFLLVAQSQGEAFLPHCYHIQFFAAADNKVMRKIDFVRFIL